LSQYGAVYQLGNKVFYSRYKLNDFGSVEKNRIGQTIFTLYEGEITEDGEIINSKEFKSSDEFVFNSSTVAFSSDRKYMYVTTNEEKRGDVYKHDNRTRNLRIERGEFVEGKGYRNFKPLAFCDANYSYAHPAISPDGKYIYFTSNIPSAKGPTDIFRVKIEGDNKFGEPENLGNLINSPRKEMFPTITNDNVLYFSSDRARGVGGLDIYKCIIDEDDNIGLPKLMPQPVNSRGDDICYVLNKNGKEGYFTSNRVKGKGEDDIYYFEIKE
jgi:Tol biopolymer transport system component